MTTNLDNDTLEWAAQWLEGSLKGEENERVREFARNIAMTFRAAKLDSRAPVAAPVNVADLVPTNWLDSLLSGPDAVIGKPPYGCPDIERLLRAVKDRIIKHFATTAPGAGKGNEDEEL